jgi:hypothetical protein
MPAWPLDSDWWRGGTNASDDEDSAYERCCTAGNARLHATAWGQSSREGQVSILRYVYVYNGGADAVAILVIMALHPNTFNATHAKQGKSARSSRGRDAQKLARAYTIA